MWSDRNIAYKREWFNKILLRSNEMIEGYDENIFFDPSQTKAHVKS